MEVKNFSRLDLENNQGNQGNLQDLNDSINTEISAGDEKSVSQKISDQPTFLFKSLPLYSDTQGLHRKFSKSFKQGINYICNDSTEINSKPQSNILSNKSINFDELSFNHINQWNQYNFDLDHKVAKDKKKLSSSLKLIDKEYTEEYRKYENLKKKIDHKQEEFNENKSEYQRIKSNNTNLKKMIVNLIKQQDEK